ncbi:uncharacterized protein K452DRAFT_198297, partial [Aplosporella prunicola CBS 121167]
LRRQMYEWLNGPGSKLRQPLPGSSNYLGAYDRYGQLQRLVDREKPRTVEAEEPEEGESAKEEATQADFDMDTLPPAKGQDLMPFPLNQNFKSQNVLSEALRERIYEEIAVEKQPIQIVSSKYMVTMERVAAVVRLKTIEKQWVQEGKGLATPYSKAVLAMLPRTELQESGRQLDHEPIQDLPVHPATRQQIFYPTSESRHFTREDAAKVFARDLLPADKRIPHPDLVEAERDMIAGLSFEERVNKQRQRDQKRAEALQRAERKRAEKAARVSTVRARRWDFKFEEFSVDQVGTDGKSPGGVGWRYGNPHNDRKRGLVKIPKKVD